MATASVSGGETDDQLQVKALQASIPHRSVDPRRCRMEEEWDVEADAGGVQRVERRAIELVAGVRADHSSEQPEVDGAFELGDGGIDVLRRQRGQSAEAIGRDGDEVAEEVVVPPAEWHGDVGWRVVQIGQRVRRQDLERDSRSFIASNRRSTSRNGVPRYRTPSRT